MWLSRAFTHYCGWVLAQPYPWGCHREEMVNLSSLCEPAGVGDVEEAPPPPPAPATIYVLSGYFCCGLWGSQAMLMRWGGGSLSFPSRESILTVVMPRAGEKGREWRHPHLRGQAQHQEQYYLLLLNTYMVERVGRKGAPTCYDGLAWHPPRLQQR